MIMSFSQWMFGGFDNPPVNGRWGLLHILTLVACVGAIIGAYFLVKKSKNPEKTRKVILYSLAGAIAFFEVMMRFVHFIRLYYFQFPEMADLDALWIIIPKPWCAVSCWLLIACVFVKKEFFYNFASLSASLCSVIFFSYPGVGYNNQYLIFENWYSILTHALLLTTSIVLIVLKFTNFRYREIWKVAIGFALTMVYALLQIYVLKTQVDPMYFMPNGDIQGILGVSYGVYLTLYIGLIVVYVNAFHIVQDWAVVKDFFQKVKTKLTRKA